MEYIKKSLVILAKASKGNPATAALVVMLMYIMFNLFEGFVEFLLFDKRFEHWLDPIFVICFIAYSAASVLACAQYNSDNA